MKVAWEKLFDVWTFWPVVGLFVDSMHYSGSSARVEVLRWKYAVVPRLVRLRQTISRSTTELVLRVQSTQMLTACCTH